MDFGAIVTGAVGGVSGGSLAVLLAWWLIRRGEKFEDEHRRHTDARLAKAEDDIDAIERRCAGCEPTVRRHDEELRTVNVPLFEEKLRRAIDAALDAEAGVEPMRELLTKTQTLIEQLLPEVRDLRNYVRNVSRMSQRKDHALEVRIAVLEGRTPPLAPSFDDLYEEADDAA